MKVKATIFATRITAVERLGLHVPGGRPEARKTRGVKLDGLFDCHGNNIAEQPAVHIIMSPRFSRSASLGYAAVGTADATNRDSRDADDAADDSPCCWVSSHL